MKFALCTISFRHQLISFSEIAAFARQHKFDGIEMWGIHAERLYEHNRGTAEEEIASLGKNGIHISMLSDYLNIDPQVQFEQTLFKCDRLITLAKWLGTGRIRTFAGQRSSQLVTTHDRLIYVERLQRLSERCRRHGIQLIVETHPGTLADNLYSTMELLYEAGESGPRLNFDVMHVWEFGGEVTEHYKLLEPWVEYFHFKNVSSPQAVSIFEPANIYAASGEREGMTLLSEGIIDYSCLMRQFVRKDCYAAIEWFGAAPNVVLSREIEWLRKTRTRLAGKSINNIIGQEGISSPL